MTDSTITLLNATDSLAVIAHGSQSQPMFEARIAGGGVVFSIGPVGEIVLTSTITSSFALAAAGTANSFIATNTVTSGEFQAVQARGRATAVGASTAETRGVYARATTNDNLYGGTVTALQTETIAKTGSTTVNLRGIFAAVDSEGTPAAITNLYGGYLRTKTSVAPATDFYGLVIENETFGGGVTADAGLLFKGTATGGFTYGIDINGATIATADIRGASGDTLSNLAAGTWTVSGILSATTLSATTITDGTFSATAGVFTAVASISDGTATWAGGATNTLAGFASVSATTLTDGAITITSGVISSSGNVRIDGINYLGHDGGTQFMEIRNTSAAMVWDASGCSSIQWEINNADTLYLGTSALRPDKASFNLGDTGVQWLNFYLTGDIMGYGTGMTIKGGNATTEPLTLKANTADTTSIVLGTTHMNLIGGQTFSKTNVADANYAPGALTSDKIVAFTAISAPHTYVIPTEDRDTGTTTQPRIITIIDESGDCDPVDTITISLETAGNINGAGTFVLDSGYGFVTIEINGTNGFVVGGS